MVEVFKTNVKKKQHARMLIDQIGKTFCNYTANFDLEDCDKILRVEGVDFSVDLIIEKVRILGYRCEVLE